jgi:hypothetical protein
VGCGAVAEQPLRRQVGDLEWGQQVGKQVYCGSGEEQVWEQLSI